MFVNKIVGIKASRAYFLTIRVIIFQHMGCIFIHYYALYIYMRSVLMCRRMCHSVIKKFYFCTLFQI